MVTLVAVSLTIQCEIIDSYSQLIVNFVVNGQEFVLLQVYFEIWLAVKIFDH